MVKLLLKIAFHGKNYEGFQSQKNGRTVQETLTQAASKVFGTPCLVTGCSRTDSGVHALGFCATVIPEEPWEQWCTIPPDKIHKAFHAFLPEDIAVWDTALVDMDFHPRYDVAYKEYLYRISDSLFADPFQDGMLYHISKKISDSALLNMQQAAANYIGKRDFCAFMAQGSKVTDSVRTIVSSRVQRTGDLIEFRVAADGFLYNMVRILTGTLLDVAFGKISAAEIEEIIASKDRKKAGITVPPHGLYLNKVVYARPVQWTFNGDSAYLNS